MDTLIIIAVVVLIVGAACAYIYRQKKRGARCIGCPAGESCCSSGCGGCSCGCGGTKE